jgi:hypothetical protein
MPRYYTAVARADGPRYRSLVWHRPGVFEAHRSPPVKPLEQWLNESVPVGWDVMFMRELRQMRPEEGTETVEVIIQRRVNA